jgi:hypothetical protein
MAIAESALESICASKEANMDKNGIIDSDTRKAQVRGNGGIYVNITNIGRRVHGIGKSDEVQVTVHEDGIWIEPFDAGEQTSESD